MATGKRNPRNCHFCAQNGEKTRAWGEFGDGRVRVGGPGQSGPITVSGSLVNAGQMYNVCDMHKAAVIVARATGRSGGHAARQAAETALVNADATEQAEAAARAPRLAALVRAAWSTLTAEELAALKVQAARSDYRTGHGALSADAAWDEVTGRFAERVADRAFNGRESVWTVDRDTVDAVTAVNAVDRAAVMRGLSYVHATRKGARDSSMDAARTSKTGADTDGQGASWTPDYAVAVDRSAGTADGYRLESGKIIGRDSLLTLARKMIIEGHPMADTAAELLADAGMSIPAPRDVPWVEYHPAALAA
jgi:hypothetical protein